MARTKISEFSATAADNTDIDNINIAEGCAPSGINNAIRELMAQLKDMQTGASGDTFTLTTVNSTTVDTTNLEVSNIKAKDGTAAGSIADSTGVVTLTNLTGTTADYTNLEVTNIKAKDGTAAATIADSTGVMTVKNLVTGGGTISPQTGFKNRIINGGMVIDQRNAVAAVATDNAYPVDRFGQRQVGGGVLSYQRSSTAPAGFINSLSVTVTTADASIAAGDNYQLFQRIEGLNIADLGWGTANAQAVTLSFLIRSSLTGTFGGALINSASDRSYVFQYTISVADTWEYKTIVVPGDTSGTWLTTNGLGVGLIFDMGSGSNFEGTANAWNAAQNRRASGNVQLVGTLNATFYITGAQLEKGSVATPFEFRSIGQELALCQRYYYRIAPAAVAKLLISGGSFFTSSQASLSGTFPVQMRAAPSALEQTGTANQYSIVQAGFGGAACTSVPVFSNASVNNFLVTGTSTGAAFTAAYPASMSTDPTNGATAFLAWSAEL